MSRQLKGTSPSEKSRFDHGQVREVVRAVIEDVRTGGDAAVRHYSEKFDTWSPMSFQLDRDTIEAIVGRLPQQVVNDILEVQANVREFAQRQLDSMHEFDVATKPGVRLGQKHIPITATGAYVPGGRYALTASAHMTVVTAKVAGVERVTACTPPIRGEVPAAMVAVLHLAGADEILPLGGVQAIAALTLGTETIDRVDLIDGPGNAYVAEAERRLFGEVGIDLFAGPTEILIVADEHADLFIVAVDLLSQAEHGPDSPAILITASEGVAGKAMQHVEALLSGMSTLDMAGPAWRDYGQVHLADSFREAYSFACEHVQILTAEPRLALDHMRHYGALFLGEVGTCVSYGDKMIGTNHVLPTRGAARHIGGLWVGKYLRTVTDQEITETAASARLGEHCGRTARVELFKGHARSGDIRPAKYAGPHAPRAEAVQMEALAGRQSSLGGPRVRCPADTCRTGCQRITHKQAHSELAHVLTGVDLDVDETVQQEPTISRDKPLTRPPQLCKKDGLGVCAMRNTGNFPKGESWPREMIAVVADAYQRFGFAIGSSVVHRRNDTTRRTAQRSHKTQTKGDYRDFRVEN